MQYGTQKKFFNRPSAMTLTELLIAAILVGVLISGALSADYAIRAWNRRIGERNLTQQTLMIAMEQIVKDAENANGFGITNTAYDGNTGISYVKDAQTALIMFRQEPDSGDPYFVVYKYNADQGSYIYRYYENTDDGAQSDPEAFLNHSDPLNFFQINTNGSRVETISFSLKTHPYPEEPEDPLNNPVFSLETMVFPEGVTQ